MTRSDPSGKNTFHIQSVLATDTNGIPTRRISASVRSSPPKNGWINIDPITQIFWSPALHALTATWCTKFPPALSPARKHFDTSVFSGKTVTFSSRNLSTASPSSYCDG
uniref:Uncharacterized protein n=1 Tax=Medicago truncatula TaxID=3880 RepID=I3T6N3_MEDTR|nr:unknown [Medicago truncatula]